jgi:hypothetical protein
MIKIVSGYTGRGGSTTAFINLTNAFNAAGLECTFYGNEDWHINKCQSDFTRNLVTDSEDILITHFLQLNVIPEVKKTILACHEKWWFDVGGIKQYWNEVVFLHQQHRDYHSKYKGPYSIIPNIKEPLVPKEKPELDMVAGIIGTIEDRKQTHVSIQRAMRDKCSKIYLFGHVGDQNYFKANVEPLINSKITLMGHTTDKQKMYDSIGRVYHSSKGEVACLVKDECFQTNTKFFGNEETQHEVSTLTNDEIINLWKKVLEI